jgi:hypothetical protein
MQPFSVSLMVFCFAQSLALSDQIVWSGSARATTAVDFTVVRHFLTTSTFVNQATAFSDLAAYDGTSLNLSGVATPGD